MGPRLRGGDTAFRGEDRSPMTRLLRTGIAAAVVALVLDQASKLWLLYVFDIGRRGSVALTPFFDLVLAWNTGISYGWFADQGPAGQAIMLAIKAIAVVALAIWMARSTTRLATVALGLIIGGAIGNAIDRLAWGAVVDFALLHVQIGERIFSWYVFNIADVAIVAGVAALLYDSFFGQTAAKAP
jgi:signal peptidase II